MCESQEGNLQGYHKVFPQFKLSTSHCKKCINLHTHTQRALQTLLHHFFAKQEGVMFMRGARMMAIPHLQRLTVGDSPFIYDNASDANA